MIDYSFKSMNHFTPSSEINDNHSPVKLLLRLTARTDGWWHGGRLARITHDEYHSALIPFICPPPQLLQS